MNRRLIIILAIPAILVCACVGLGGVVYVSGSGERNANATKTATANQMMPPLRALCTGQAGGVAEAANYTAGPGIHPMIAFRTLNATNYNHDSRVGTGDWAADSLAETQLVACEEDTWVTVESCEYTGRTTGVTSTLNRLQNQVKIRLVAAKTGQVVATQTLMGTMPRECMDTETFASGTTTMSVSGDAVAVSDIQAFLRTHVAP